MPVSENEETGVKPVSWKSSDYITDVPIKKRRFPLFQPSSPPPEKSSSSPLGTNSNQNRQSSECKGISVSNVSVPASLPGMPDAKNGKSDMEVAQTNVSVAAASSEVSVENKNSVFKEEKQNIYDENVKADVTNESKAEFKELELSVCYISSVDLDIREKAVPADKADNIMSIAEKTDLKLEPNEALFPCVGKQTYDQHTMEGESISERSVIFGTADLSLSLNNDNPSTVMGQNEEGSQNALETLEPVSLNLFLSNGDGNKGNAIQSNGEGPNLQADAVFMAETVEDSDRQSSLHANRSNWDLNTPMDSWGDSTSGAAEGQLTADRLSTGDGDLVNQPFICLPMVESGDATEKKILKESEHRYSIARPSTLSGQNYFPEDSLNLHPSPSGIPFSLSLEPSCSSIEVDSGKVFSNIRMLRGLSVGNLDTINRSSVKTEQSEDGIKPGLAGGKTNPMGFSDFNVKSELNEVVSREVLKLSNSCSLKPVDPRSIKSESFLGVNGEPMKTLKRPLDNSNKMVLQAQDVGNPTCSTNFSIKRGKSDVLEHSVENKGTEVSEEEVPKKDRKGEVSEEVLEKDCEGQERLASEIISGPAGPIGNEENVVTTADTEMTTDKNVENPEQFRLQLTDKFGQQLDANDGDCVSDMEKINIPSDMLEEDSYVSDCESDGNHDLNVYVITERNHEEEDYEDGEVREQLVHTAEEGPTHEKTEEKFIETNLNNEITNYAGLPGDGDPSSSQFCKNDPKIVDPSEMNDDTFVDGFDTAYNGSADLDGCLQESSVIGMPTSESERKMPVPTVWKESLDISEGRVASEVQEAEKQSDQGIDGGQGTMDSVPLASDDNIEKSIMVENNEMALCKKESSLDGDNAGKDGDNAGKDGDNAGKDVDGRGNRSRIINLARSSNVSPPSNSRYMPGKLLSSRPGKERLPDMALERDNLNSRGRDEICNISSHKFTRESHQDQLPRNSRFNYGRGRGRVSNCGDTPNDDWKTKRDFGPGYYNGRTEFRRKYAPGVAEAEIGCNNYNIDPDGKFVSSGRGGRKLLNHEAPTFHRRLLNGRSPRGRNGPAHSLQMIHRGTRNMSPNRCMGDDGTEVVGLRNGEKLVRVFPDDGVDHEQHPYDGESNFFGMNRNFSSAHRRGGISRIRSKSPTRSRSPGPWSSPRRRLPDGFSGQPELPHRRSGPIYRMGRVRSPDPPCYPGEMLTRRRGSPLCTSHPSNDLREVESRHNHGQPRSVIPGRSSAGRVVLRNNQRFDMVDPRERNDGDEFFAGPMHSSRFSELGDEAGIEERRRYSERQGPVRSFRPRYDGVDGGSFYLNTEDGPRPFRFCPEDDPDFHERGNREFHRRIKIRPGNVPRRTRGIEDEEGNYRHGEQVMYDNGFDDGMSRAKRKRF